MSRARKDYTAERFGRLVLTNFSHTSKGGHQYYFVRCDCGMEKAISLKSMKSGDTKSCGCLNLELVSARYKEIGAKSKTHGEGYEHEEYTAWMHLKARCLNPNDSRYSDYGGRGIRVCTRWLSYENFLADMGRKPGPEYSIDRVDNSGNYEPTNCRWATAKEQASNRRPRRWGRKP